MQNTFSRLSLLAVAVVLTVDSWGQSGAPFSLHSFTVSPGGGVSRGGEFNLAGIIGQQVAQPVLTGGAFRLEPGLWSVPTIVQTPGAPSVRIRLHTANQAILSWPVSVNGFTLEACADPGLGVWTPVDQAVQDTATEHTVTVPTMGNQCYRLRK